MIKRCLLFFSNFRFAFHTYRQAVFPSQDLLHTLHHGVSLCAIAALVTDHFNCKYPGQTLSELEKCLLHAYKHYKDWCRAKKLSGRSLRFTLNRFGRESWKTLPELSTQYKASTVKYTQYWMHDFLMEEGACPSSEDRCACSYSLAMFQYMLDTNGERFTPRIAGQTATFGFRFLLFYQKLAVRSRSEARNNYKIVPKFHYLYHLLEYIRDSFRNPRQGLVQNKFAQSLCNRKFVFQIPACQKKCLSSTFSPLCCQV